MGLNIEDAFKWIKVELEAQMLSKWNVLKTYKTAQLFLSIDYHIVGILDFDWSEGVH